MRVYSAPKPGSNLEADAMFLRMVTCVKQILLWIGQKEGPLGTLLEYGEEPRANLRKSLESIDQITGIPKTMVLERENSKWSLKLGAALPKAQDELLEEAKYQSLFSDFLGEISPILPNYVTEDLSRYHYVIANNLAATWRQGQRAQGIAKIFDGFKENRIGALRERKPLTKIDNIAKRTNVISKILGKEKAIAKIIALVYKVMSTSLKEMKRAKQPLALKRNVRPLVPGRVRGHERKKSVSLITQESEGVRPFALYSVKKDHIAASTENTMANNTPRSHSSLMRMATEESKVRKNTETVYLWCKLM